MFSGIVETTASVVRATPGEAILKLVLERPPSFDDLTVGDSIAVNGCCLTVETFDAREMSFALGPETLKVTGWSAAKLPGTQLNVERSLRLNDRIHGHLVTGHVDTLSEITGVDKTSETVQLRVAFPHNLKMFIWPKGSVAINGVSLTVNAVEDLEQTSTFTLGLIPETLRRTNLGELKLGSRVNLELDNMARGLVRFAQTGGAAPWA